MRPDLNFISLLHLLSEYFNFLFDFTLFSVLLSQRHIINKECVCNIRELKADWRLFNVRYKWFLMLVWLMVVDVHCYWWHLVRDATYSIRSYANILYYTPYLYISEFQTIFMKGQIGGPEIPQRATCHFWIKTPLFYGNKWNLFESWFNGMDDILWT